MRIDKISSSGPNLILNAPRPVISGRGTDQAQRKSLGETPPIVLSLDEIGKLASLFAPRGLIDRLTKRLNYLKKKNCKVIPAKGMVVCVDGQDVVYLGVDFLEAHLNDQETLAGAMSHEWGHACALRPHSDSLQELTWDEIFELRRAHETLADEICGRLLFLMGYKTDGIIRFLKKGSDTHNLKYHHPDIRAQVIRYGFESEKRKADLSKSLFKKGSYKNDYDSTLLDIV
ncbi:MAG TPA: hypothetical protein DDW49_00010 [Deltaproteobacteria bacterium]|nr:MAG: hypothetical protein A2048_05100 [Deltaproteobacteria bacterium GWA2_45_12]HBF11771.1 hypothetical protein [Deltaproteobacteria bacterium]